MWAWETPMLQGHSALSLEHMRALTYMKPLGITFHELNRVSKGTWRYGVTMRLSHNPKQLLLRAPSLSNLWWFVCLFKNAHIFLAFQEL